MSPADHPIIDRVRALAKLHGWGVGVHGSLERDIDLIAVPWTEDASPLPVIVSAFEQVLGMPVFGREGRKPLARRGYLFKHPEAVDMGHRGDWKAKWEPPVLDVSFVDHRVLERDQPRAAACARGVYDHEGD